MNINTITKKEVEILLSKNFEFEKFLKNNKKFFEEILNRYNLRKLFPYYMDKEDLMQEIYLSVYKALKNYDQTKSKFSTFAWTVIKNDLLIKRNYLFSKKNNFKQIEISEIFYSKKKNNVLEENLIEQIDLNNSNLQLSQLFKKIFKEVLNGKNNLEIAKSLNINSNTFDYIYINYFFTKLEKIAKNKPKNFFKKFEILKKGNK